MYCRDVAVIFEGGDCEQSLHGVKREIFGGT
jgi:hypothetical protein